MFAFYIFCFVFFFPFVHVNSCVRFSKEQLKLCSSNSVHLRTMNCIKGLRNGILLYCFFFFVCFLVL